MKTFEDLDCWKKASALRRKLSTLAKKLPSDEKYKLADQLIRAARSVTANIAEGFGRFHYQEYVQFCRHSRGSLYEIVDHLIVAEEEKYISKLELDNYKNEIEDCLAVLNGFINYLGRTKQNKVNEPEISYSNSDND
jgi:four helix bundle protein